MRSHYLSDRAPHPFIAVNCGSLTDTLLEDELFGHERGAFTDAHQARIGLVAQAHRGTVFLDEVDSLSPRAQVALLRVAAGPRIPSSRLRRSSGSADVRFLAATNTPLLELTSAAGSAPISTTARRVLDRAAAAARARRRRPAAGAALSRAAPAIRRRRDEASAPSGGGRCSATAGRATRASSRTS